MSNENNYEEAHRWATVCAIRNREESEMRRRMEFMGDALERNTVNSVTVEQVIKVRFNRGSGGEGNPTRWVEQYWTMDGKLLAERDPITPSLGNEEHEEG